MGGRGGDARVFDWCCQLVGEVQKGESALPVRPTHLHPSQEDKQESNFSSAPHSRGHLEHHPGVRFPRDGCPGHVIISSVSNRVTAVLWPVAAVKTVHLIEILDVSQGGGPTLATAGVGAASPHPSNSILGPAHRPTTCQSAPGAKCAKHSKCFCLSVSHDRERRKVGAKGARNHAGSSKDSRL